MPKRPAAKPRFDTYGDSLTALRPAEREDLRQHPTNVAGRAHLKAVYDEMAAGTLTRDFYGTFTVTVTIEGGIMQPTIVETTARHRRT